MFPCQIIEDRAIRPCIAVTGRDQVTERAPQALQFADLLVDPRDMGLRQFFDIAAGATLVFIERQKHTAILNRKSKPSGSLKKGQFV
jgi:hypothetical protein